MSDMFRVLEFILNVLMKLFENILIYCEFLVYEWLIFEGCVWLIFVLMFCLGLL